MLRVLLTVALAGTILASTRASAPKRTTPGADLRCLVFAAVLLYAVGLAASLHPGLAARSLAIDPTGSFLLVADRPANLVRSYAIDRGTGELAPLTDVPIGQPAFVTFAEERP